MCQAMSDRLTQTNFTALLLMTAKRGTKRSLAALLLLTAKHKSGGVCRYDASCRRLVLRPICGAALVLLTAKHRVDGVFADTMWHAASLYSKAPTQH